MTANIYCTMPLLTLVTTCKARLAHLQQTLPQMMAQTRHDDAGGSDDVRCIVVDYDCPEGPSTRRASALQGRGTGR